jgi:hypothetical protein
MAVVEVPVSDEVLNDYGDGDGDGYGDGDGEEASEEGGEPGLEEKKHKKTN